MAFIAGKARLLERCIRNIEKIITVIGGVMLALMMFLGTADVIGRYVFNRPLLGAAEASGLMMGAAVFLSWAYVQSKGGHISLDIISDHYPPRVRAVLNFVMLFLLLVLFSLITYKGGLIAKKAWHLSEMVQILEVPIAPFKLLVPIGAFFICLECIIQMVHLFPEMAGRKRQ
jgi:TRAP-type C4-dicarboxylate transport system permease small subunit